MGCGALVVSQLDDTLTLCGTGHLPADSGIAGFSADAFAADTTAIEASLTGRWRIAEIGNTLALVYPSTAVPAPARWALVASLAGAGAVVWRRRRRR